VDSAFHEDVPAGYVISQLPFPGQVIKRQRRVRFTLSLGEELVTVPELKELSPSQASDTLQRLGLRLGKTLESYSARMTPGAIIASSPPAGSSMPKGGLVDITISQSSLTGKTYMPDFKDMSFQAAQTLLAKLHLRMGEATYRKHPELVPGTVMEQSHKAGTRVDRGTHIDFVVSE
jgi:serine/threonine-protein kinase